MIDVSPKFYSLRYAKAEGYLYGNVRAMAMVADRKVPKGDVLEVARAAGIMAAKRCSDHITFCHPIPLDWVEVEAITGVTGALLNAYDMLKPLDADLSFSNIRVVQKRGGKSDFVDDFVNPVKTAVLVISDSTHAGTRKDKSGLIIKDFLVGQPADVAVYEVLPDDRRQIAARLKELADKEKMQLVFTTGGTGLGPRDVTPEATLDALERTVPGIVGRSAGTARTGHRTPCFPGARQACGENASLLIFPAVPKGRSKACRPYSPDYCIFFRC